MFHYGNDTSKGELLRGVNMKILPGQNVAIVGPSGSGKSTTLRLISRMLDPSSGQVMQYSYRNYTHQSHMSQQHLQSAGNAAF